LHSTFHNDAQRCGASIFADDDCVFIREVEQAIASQPGDGLTLSIDCVYDTRWVKWASKRSFLLLARQVLRIAREHDRLWSGLIKLQGNGGSDVTSDDVPVKNE